MSDEHDIGATPGEAGAPGTPIVVLREAERLAADEALWIAPPADLFERITSARPIGAGDSARPTAAAHAGRPWHRPVRLFAAAAMAAVVLGAGVLVGRAGRDERRAGLDEPPVASLALVGTAAAPRAEAQVEVFDRGAGYALILATTGLDPAPEGTLYQGWLRSAAGAEVSIGTFHMRSGDDDVVLWSGVPLAEYPRLVITRDVVGAGRADPGVEVMIGELTAP
jgi:hypothetical protein